MNETIKINWPKLLAEANERRKQAGMPKITRLEIGRTLWPKSNSPRQNADNLINGVTDSLRFCQTIEILILFGIKADELFSKENLKID